ncbi:hypothetical protein [Microbacterium sp. VKM Ac-2923]|uniref:hypothetical protein n=1 Tax=Microbacterium sp. VKM Ac-2923 TaxID=2929476 RepID=UPI001FB3F403|nr:hypothetical protein [Microbacterium sp. VKM Ac-2923]MCJ1707145.1 hypothetical protein [Microbacterium sp. VKM Ac-2923]
MTDAPDATGGDVERVVPVPSTGSGTSAASEVASAASEVAELVEASGSLAAVEEAELVGASGTSAASEVAASSPPRQPVVRVSGSRRARLLPAPGTTAEPAPADDRERGRGSKPAASGPNDDRMLGDVPPHY